MWIYYSVQNNDLPMIVRSSTEISLLAISAIYIIRNKIADYERINRVLPVFVSQIQEHQWHINDERNKPWHHQRIILYVKPVEKPQEIREH